MRSPSRQRRKYDLISPSSILEMNSFLFEEVCGYLSVSGIHRYLTPTEQGNQGQRKESGLKRSLRELLEYHGDDLPYS